MRGSAATAPSRAWRRVAAGGAPFPASQVWRSLRARQARRRQFAARSVTARAILPAAGGGPPRARIRAPPRRHRPSRPALASQPAPAAAGRPPSRREGSRTGSRNASVRKGARTADRAPRAAGCPRAASALLTTAVLLNFRRRRKKKRGGVPLPSLMCPQAPRDEEGSHYNRCLLTEISIVRRTCAERQRCTRGPIERSWERTLCGKLQRSRALAPHR